MLNLRFLAAGAAVGVAPLAGATMYDLTHAGSQVEVGNVVFETSDFRPAGTGVIRSFVRLQSAGTEQGYNTSARPVAFDELTDPNFTRDVQVKDLGVQAINGANYFQFSLDINENNSPTGRYLSLDRVQIYVSSTGSHTGTDLSQLGTKVYDLDSGSDNWIDLNYRLNSGSGQGDMRMFVPVTLFNPFSTSSFVTLYSKFGSNEPSNAGFEEWTSLGALVPAPGMGALGGAALLVCGRRRRRSA
jgi:hypothetical protein